MMNITNVVGELGKENIILLVLPSTSYSAALIDLVKQLNKSKEGQLYVTLNNPYLVLIKRFKDNNIDSSRLFFIDAISKSSKLKTEAKNCVFVDSPSSLTALSISIIEFIKKKPDVIIFDSLSTLSIYLPIKAIIGFAHSLITKIRENNVKAVFPITNNEELIKNMSMFISKVVELE